MRRNILLMGCFVLLAVIGFFRLSKKIRLLDKPHLYADTRGKRGPIPTLQGGFLFVILFLLILIFQPGLLQEQMVQGLLVGGGLLMIIGCVDDVAIGRRLPALVRFGLQIAIVAGVIRRTGIGRTHITLFDHTITFGPLIGSVISLGWFLLCINAMNWFDGNHGQASGTSSIGFFTIRGVIEFVVIPHFPDITASKIHTLDIVQTLSLRIGILSVLYTVMERKPWGLVRDAGTLFYGFALAYLSLLGGAKIGTIVVVLSLVLFDAIWVIGYRILIAKKMPRKGDFTHLHHRLQAMHRTKKEINVFTRTRSLVLMILMLLQGTNKLNKLIIFVMMATIFFGVNFYLFGCKKKRVGLEGEKED